MDPQQLKHANKPAEESNVRLEKKEKSYYVTYRLVSDIPDLYNTVINPLGCQNVRDTSPLRNVGMDTSHYDAKKQIRESSNVDISGEPVKLWNELDNGTPYLMATVRYGKDHYITDQNGNKLMTSYDAYEQGIIKGVSVQFNDAPFRDSDTVKSPSGRIIYNKWWLTRISVLVSTTGDVPGQPTSGEVAATLRKLNQNNNIMQFKEGDILTVDWLGRILTGELTEFSDELYRIEGMYEGKIFEATLPTKDFTFTLADDQTTRCMLCDAKKKKREAEEAEAKRIADEKEAVRLAEEAKIAEEKRLADEQEAKKRSEEEAANQTERETVASDIAMLKEAVTGLQTAITDIQGHIQGMTESRTEETRQLDELKRSFLESHKTDTPQVRSVETKTTPEVQNVFEMYGKV